MSGLDFGAAAGGDEIVRSTPGIYAAVAGGVNIDIGGRPFQKLERRTSNPGQVKVSLGGVGRNIAHNLRLLGTRVKLFTAFGDDIYASQIEGSCARLGIDVSHARILKDGATSVYLFISDEEGDMDAAVADMRICEAITPKYLEGQMDIINDAGVLVLDTNLPEESVRFLTENSKVPIFADPVSMAKSEKLIPCLGRIHTLKPNKNEAEKLSGVRITDSSSLYRASEKLLDTGLERVFISLGAEGVFAADQNGAQLFPACPAAVKNTTGSGDAFMAGLVRAYLEGFTLSDTTRFASACASITAEGEETINPALSYESAMRRKNI